MLWIRPMSDRSRGTTLRTPIESWFFFQAAAGIRDLIVTGVQTCALPISSRSMFGQFLSVSPCPSCAGDGTVILEPCPKCQGDGRVRAEKTIEINVPAGVADHHYLPMRGQGVPGPRHRPPRALIGGVDIAEEPRVQRHGDHLGV